MVNKIVLTNPDGIIMKIGTDFKESTTEPGVVVFLDGCGYGIHGQIVYKDVEVPEYVQPQIYKYDGTTFTEYEDERTRIANEAIDKYTLEMLGIEDRR